MKYDMKSFCKTDFLIVRTTFVVYKKALHVCVLETSGINISEVRPEVKVFLQKVTKFPLMTGYVYKKILIIIISNTRL